MKVFTLLLLSIPAFCGESFVFTSGRTGTATISGAPYTTLTDFYIDIRISRWATPSDYAAVFNHANLVVLWAPVANTLWVGNLMDNSGGLGTYQVIDISAYGDMVLRVHRRFTDKLFVTEIWNTDGSGYSITSWTMASVTQTSFAGTLTFGGAQTNADAAYIRWYSGTKALNSQPPTNTAGGDLGDWEFENNGNDSSTNSLNTTLQDSTACPTCYTTTPTYVPAALVSLPGTQSHISDPAMRTGHSFILDGSNSFSLGPDATLTYAWTQNSGAVLTFGTPSASTTTVTAPSFGEYSVRLTVTDSAAQSSHKDLVFGAVITDDNYIVTPADSNISYMFGKTILFGKNPWEFADDAHRTLSEKWGNKYNVDPQYSASWQTLAAGTVSTIGGTPTVTGVGTNFQHDFCGDGTTPVNQSIIVFYNGTDKLPWEVTSCTSATSMDVGTYFSLPTLTNVQYSAMNANTGAPPGLWGYGNPASNVNYYDNVLAHYNLYYRNGLTKYRDYGRALTALWVDSPWWGTWGFPRYYALNGIIWAAYEQNDSALWSKIEAFLDTKITDLTAGTWVGDVRENAYLSSYFANAAKLDPNATKAASYLAAVNTAITDVWIPNRNAGGYSIQDNLGWNWPSNAYDQLNFHPLLNAGQTTATVPAETGSVTATNGSTAVVGIGTSLQTRLCRGGATPPHLTNTAQERIVIWTGTEYIPALVSSCTDETHITLTTAWSRPTASDVQWSLSWPYWTMEDIFAGQAANTATLTNGSTTVTISGTNAQDVFCGYQSGRTTPNFNSFFTAKLDATKPNWQDPTAADQADSRVFRSVVASCDSSTQITLSNPWPYTSSSSLAWGAGQTNGTTASGQQLWFESDPKEVGYEAVFTDPVHAVLDKPAVNNVPTSGTLEFRVAGGPTVQPFMVGLAASGFNWMWQLTGNTIIRDYVTGNINWLIANAIIPGQEGYLYDIGPGCWADPFIPTYCGGILATQQGVWSARYLTAETYNGYSAAFTISNDANIKTAADNLYSACFGRSGYNGSTYDSTFCEEISEAYGSSYDKAKTLGFFFGMGNIASWPAARLTTVAPVIPISNYTVVVTQSVNGASAVVY